MTMTSIISQQTFASTPAIISISLFLVRATLLLLLALAATAALRRASAGARHIVWVGVLGAVVLLPLISYLMPLRLPVLPRAISSETVSQAAVAPRWPEASRTPGESGSDSRKVMQVGAPETAAETSLSGRDGEPVRGGEFASVDASNAASLPATLTLLWVIGTALLLARLLLGVAAVRRVLRGARPLDSAEWKAPLWEVADRLDLTRTPRLLCSHDVSMPFACGLVHPAVVLPAEAEQWGDERRRAVLFHELAHVRRRDLLGHTLGRIACALYWFHPLVWAAARRMRSESESACDDLVLTSGTLASDYAHHLLEIVTGSRNASAPVTALAMARPKEFEGRMLAILDPDRQRAAPRPLQAGALVAGLAALTLSVSAMAPAVARPPARALDASGATHSGTALTDTIGSPSIPQVESTLASRDNDVLASSSDLSDGENHEAPGHAVTGTIDRSPGEGGRRDDAIAPADSGTVDLLVKLLASDADAKVRRTAAWALVQREPRDSRAASAALSAALARDSSADVREMAAWGLGQLGDDAAVPALSDALRRESNERVRTTITWALGTIGDASSAAALGAAMADRSSKVRARAAWALGQIEPDAAPAGLLAALRDSSEKVRLAAAWALGQIEDPASLEPISAALSAEQNHEIRDAELRALILLGDASEGTLQKLLESQDPDVRLKVTRAIVGFRGVRPWPWPMPMPRPMP
jgi:beta-lactamase regulating signal transducer with metallopeptidase domain